PTTPVSQDSTASAATAGHQPTPSIGSPSSALACADQPAPAEERTPAAALREQSQQPGAQEPDPASPATPALAAAEAAPWCDGSAQLERLAQLRAASTAAGSPRTRDPSWQQPRRQLEQQLRREAVALAGQLRAAGLPATGVACLLGVSSRTLRQWGSDRLA